MAWTAPRTWVAAETLTAALLNTHVRDNLLETGPAKVTTKGDLTVATAANSISRLAVGANGAILVADSAASTGVRWSGTGKTASGGLVISINIGTTLTAAANSDLLYLASLANGVTPTTFATGTFTGLTAFGLHLAFSNYAKTGTGTIDTLYGVYIDAPTIATTNWSLYIASGNSRLGGTSSNVYIGDTSNANQTGGLTINGSGELLSLKAASVAHGVTGVTETDTFSILTYANATTGGVDLLGMRTGAANYGIRLRAIVATADTTKSTAAVAGVMVVSALASGTTYASLGANTNLMAVADQLGTVRFILDSDGDSHQDVGTAWTNYDDRDDVAALNVLSAHLTRADDPLRQNFTQWLEQDRAPLEAARIVTFNDDGHHFINWSRANMLVIGAVRQLADKLTATLARLEAAEAKLSLLEG